MINKYLLFTITSYFIFTKPGRLQMLILTRKLGESLIIGDNIKITVEKITKSQVKLGIDAPKDVTVNREEVLREINKENMLSSTSGLIDQIK